MDGHRLKVAILLCSDTFLLHDYQRVFGPLDPGIISIIEESAATALFELTSFDDWNLVYEQLDAATRVNVDQIFANIGKAIAAFEERIESGASRFDRFVGQLAGRHRGPAALSTTEISGLRLFIGKAGCVSCHTGPALSDGVLHDLGLRNTAIVAPDKAVGRNAGFRTPGLRNAATSAPYMHDGRFQTLADVVDYIADVYYPSRGSAVALDVEERAQLVAFMESLTDESLSRRDPGGLDRINQSVALAD
jgi:cytochrome c peroxidase